MELATLHLLAGVITHCVVFTPAFAPPFSAAFSDWLSMMAAVGLASRPRCSRKATSNSSPNPLPHAFVLKLAENVVDRRARRKGIAGQITPGATGARQIEDRVHRRTHVGLARSSACLGRGDQRLQPRPLRIPQITWKPVARLFVRLAMLLGPHSESRAPQPCADRESRRCQ